jgi:hypothetical protein
MHELLLNAHSGWRYLALLLLVIAIVKFALGYAQKSGWSSMDRRIGLFTTIAVDIQVLLGLVLWGVAMPIGHLNPTRAFEHPTTMIVALIVMHIGWSRTRKADSDGGKFRTAALTFVLTGLLVALGVLRVTSA